MQTIKSLSLMAMTLLAVLSVSGCAGGSAEDAGEKIDEAVTDAGNAIEDACEDIKEGVDAQDQDC